MNAALMTGAANNVVGYSNPQMDAALQQGILALEARDRMHGGSAAEIGSERLGADAVGMSTVQEVIAARHAGMSVFAMSVITDLGIREEDNIITHEEVLEMAAAAEPKLTALFKGLIAQL